MSIQALFERGNTAWGAEFGLDGGRVYASGDRCFLGNKGKQFSPHASLRLNAAISWCIHSLVLFHISIFNCPQVLISLQWMCPGFPGIIPEHGRLSRKKGSKVRYFRADSP